METAILIDADKREIRYVPCKDYRDMKKHMPGGICIGWVFRDTTGDVLYVDDEALLHKAKRAFRWKLRRDGQPMMSHGLITGRDDIVETTLDPEITLEQVAQYVEWLTVEEALSWFAAKADEPASYVTDGRTKTITSHWATFLRNLRGTW